MSQVKTVQAERLPLWLPRLAGNKGPRFLQIADALQAAVVDGSLKAGDRLPAPPPDGVDFDDMTKQGLSQVLISADSALLHPDAAKAEATPLEKILRSLNEEFAAPTSDAKGGFV